MDFTMRPLKTKDIFPMSKILKKMNLKLDIEGKTQQQLGAEFVLSLVENVHLAETEINEFLGSLVGLTGEQVSELDIEDTLKLFAQFKEQKAVTNFLKLASR